MAEKKVPFAIGVKARDLMVYTYKSTRPTGSDVERESVKAIFRRVAAMDDPAQMRAVMERCAALLDHKDKGGFTKSTYNLWGRDMRTVANRIVTGVHGANNRYFATEHEDRLQRLNAVLGDCSLLLEYIQICTDAKIISIKKSGEWTGKVQDVKNMAAKWLQTDSARASKLREEEQRRADKRLAALIQAAFLAAIQQRDAQRRGQ